MAYDNNFPGKGILEESELDVKSGVIGIDLVLGWQDLSEHLLKVDHFLSRLQCILFYFRSNR